MERSHLVVDGPSGEVLIPLVDAHLRQGRSGGRVIVIDPPEGLLEVNER